jgi:hypothetical protein
VFYQVMGISGLYQPANRIVLITAEPDMRRRTVRVGGSTHRHLEQRRPIYFFAKTLDRVVTTL